MLTNKKSYSEKKYYIAPLTGRAEHIEAEYRQPLILLSLGCTYAWYMAVPTGGAIQRIFPQRFLSEH